MIARRRLGAAVTRAGAVLALLLAAAPAHARMGFVEAKVDTVGGMPDGLNGAQSVAMSADGAHVYVGGSVDDAIAVFSRSATTGSLSFVQAVFNGAAVGSSLDRIGGLVVSPDGAHVYAAGNLSKAVAVFARNSTTGALSYIEVHKDGVGGITSLDGAQGLDVSPDGANVYVASLVDAAVTVFSRNPSTGRLTFLEAFRDGDPSITRLAGAESVTVSPDGAHVYVAAQTDNALTVFARNPSTGRLTFVEAKVDGTSGVDGLNGCQAVSVSPNGAQVYTAAAGTDNAIAVFNRNASTGALTFSQVYKDGVGGVDGLGGAEWVVVSANGTSVYAVSNVDDALAVFDRNTTTGALTFVEVHKDGFNGVAGLDGATAVVVSADNRQVYPVSDTDDAVVLFRSQCGNGVFDAGEQCDDGNIQNGDCCSSTCTNEAVGAACGDDGNLCTDDKCNGVGICLHVNNVAPCDDGLFCTSNDHCQNRVCQGTMMNCSAVGDACHTGVCDEVTQGCVPQTVANGAPCDDGNACTLSDACQAGVCVGANPVVCSALDQCHLVGACDPATGVCSDPLKGNGTGCDDGTLCTRLDTCIAGTCVGADPVVCTASDQCHDVGSCNSATGVCSNPAKANGSSCNDANACTRSDTCQAGICTGANPIVCTAQDQCHVAGVCSPATGVCSNPAKASGTMCNDGSLCTRTDVCVSGSCIGSDPVVCVRQDQCHTAGTCAPATGQCSNPEAIGGTACDDGDLCTQTDICVAGVCIGGDPVTCAAQDQCHVAGVCNPATGTCSNPPKSDGAACDDGSLCTQTDRCQAGACVGTSAVVCTASDQCHVAGVCDPATGQCLDPPKPNGSACDDGSACTRSDSCQAGVCAGANSVVCTALDGCHAAGVCDPATGVCSNPPLTDGTACEDGDLCTQSGACIAGTCIGSDPIVCTAQDQCHTAGVCDPATGVCSNPSKANGTGCDDGSVCTRTDTCQAGICTGSDPIVCAAQDQCHDPGVCNPATGVCSNPSKANGAGCDDGDPCTQADTCQAGACLGANPKTCVPLDDCHVAGVCDPATGACSNPLKADGVACEDGNLCTGSGACAAGTCVGTDPILCTAQDQCHVVGTCDPATGVCSNPNKANGAACDDASACTRTDSCQAGICAGGDPVVCTAQDQCHTAGVCSPATGVCSNPSKANGAGCDDGNPCTQADACQAGVCVGGNAVVCVAVDACHTAGVCDSATGVCSNPIKANGTACDDGSACTRTDTCQAGTCTGGNPVVCAAQDQCHTAGVCSPATGVCSNPSKANGAGCDDGNPCTQADACQAGTCVAGTPVTCAPLDACHTAGVCNPATGVCSNPPKLEGAACEDGSLCTQSGACSNGTCVGGNPVVCTVQDQCHDAGVCNPATGVCSNPSKANGTACEDGNLCTQSGACSNGTCVGANPIVCTAMDQCHFAGVCDPATGRCSTPIRPDRIVVAFDAVADTYTDASSPSANFGDADTLTVDKSPVRRIFMRFAPTGISGLTVESAVVQLRVSSSSSAGSDLGGRIHSMSNVTWNELGVTHTSSPAVDGPALSSLGPVDRNQVVQFDVTATIAGDGAYAFAIEPLSDNAAIYESRESDIGRPQLVIRLAIPCDDGSACTRADQCAAGVCVGVNAVTCPPASDPCHENGMCDPATGACLNPPKLDGASCEDGDLCTAGDACLAGVCVTGASVACAPGDDCHDAGTCNPATGQCMNPVKPDGVVCEDGNLCTRSGICTSGTCVGGDPIVCTASGQCHAAGVCDPATGQCSDPARTNGTACDDGSLCTRTDTCVGGTCVGGNPVVCAALDQCHVAGVCNPASGACSSPLKGDGAACNDGNACTRSDTCRGGRCAGTNPVVCTARDTCHDAGACNPATGACSMPTRPDGTRCDDRAFCTVEDACRGGVCAGTARACGATASCQTSVCDETADACVTRTRSDGAACDDGDVCTVDDICVDGGCVGDPRADRDGDGICDPIDVCPLVSDASQSDADGDGVGDLCQCSAPAPGRCFVGGGSKSTDCLLELMPAGPVSFNRGGTKMKPLLRCSDGDPSCDLDGSRNGTCTFGVSMCFGNGDPRLPACAPDAVRSAEVQRPNPGTGDGNAIRLEQALASLGLEVRRRGQVIAPQIAPLGRDVCGPAIRLTVPAPSGAKPRPVRLKVQLRATAADGRPDADRFVLSCE